MPNPFPARLGDAGGFRLNLGNQLSQSLLQLLHRSKLELPSSFTRKPKVLSERFEGDLFLVEQAALDDEPLSWIEAVQRAANARTDHPRFLVSSHRFVLSLVVRHQEIEVRGFAAVFRGCV